MSYTICGTGTRSIVKQPLFMEGIISVMADLMRKGLERYPDLQVISGLAEGFDEAIARAAIEAGVPFAAYLPTKNYGEYYWGRKSQTGIDRSQDFEDLLAQARSIRYSSETLYTIRGNERMHANFARNIDMVNASDKVWTPQVSDPSSGTSHAISYAQQCSKGVYVVPFAA